MAGTRSQKKITGSLIAGALLVPLTAVAAAALVGSITNAQGAEAAPEARAPITVEQLATTTSATPVSDADATFTACTSGAEELLAAERDEAIDPLQTAALDALRQICQKEGLGIAGPPTPDPVVQVVTVNQPAPASGQGESLGCTDDEYESDDAYDECHDDDDDHGDHDDDDDDDDDNHDDEDDD